MTNQLATTTRVTTDLRTMLRSDTVKYRFAEALGRNPGPFISTIFTAAAINPELMECDPISVINAALQAATLDLSVSPALGQAAITPFNSKDGKKASFQIMKNGLIQLALRTNQYRALNVGNIYEGETWTEDRFTGKMTLGGGKKSNTVVGKVAYFALTNGFEKYLVMSIDEILEHAKKYSKSWSRRDKAFYPGSAWDTSFDRMCDKTVLKLLIKNYGILSDKMQTAITQENETGEIEYKTDDTEGEGHAEAIHYEDEPESTMPPVPETEEEIMQQLGFTA